MKQVILPLLLFILSLTAARTENAPDSFSIPDNTLSPDKRFGITVPASPLDEDANGEQNKLVDVKSKHVLGYINAETAFARMNNSEILPTWWSSDESYLLWEVEGKWGMATQMLVCIKGGEIQWELDVLTALQRAILARTEAVDPRKFLAAKKANWGDGSAYPEKFTIDSKPQEMDQRPLTFPVRFNVYLTSNPKGVDRIPEIDSYMEASLEKDGEITINGFHSGKSPSSPWNEVQATGH